jgi:hypothetical protein
MRRNWRKCRYYLVHLKKEAIVDFTAPPPAITPPLGAIGVPGGHRGRGAIGVVIRL